MKTITRFTTASALSAAALLALSSCGTFNSVRDLFSETPPITDVTDGEAYGTTGVRQSGRQVNSIAAKVNGNIVTMNELNIILSPIQKQLSAQFPRRGSKYYAEYNKAKKQVFQELIDRELILAEFGAQGAMIPDRAIDQEIQNRINSLYNGKTSAFLADLKKNNLSREKYRELVRRTIIVQAMRAQHFTNVTPPTPGELKTEYSKHRHKLRDITKDKAAYKKIWIPREGDDEAELGLAEDLVRQLKRGANFAELAKKHSQDAFAEDGGQWPMTNRLDLPVHFSALVFDSPTNTILGPFKDPTGYHIVKVTRKIYGPAPPMSKMKEQLKNRVQSEKSSARFNRWMERLRDKAIIKKYI